MRRPVANSAAALIAALLLPAAAWADASETCKLERDLDLALAACTEWAEQAQDDPRDLAEALLTRANRHFQMENDAAAAVDLTRVIKILPDNAAARFYRGKVFAEQGDDTRAVADYDRALALSPGWPHVLEERGDALSRLGRYPEAIADWTAALGKGRDDFRLHSVIGLAQYELGDLDAALAAFDAAVALNPANSYTYIGRGQVHEARGDVDLAMAEYLRALELNPPLWSVRMRAKLTEHGHWDGPPDGPDSPEFRAALEACVRDPDC